MLTVIVVKKGGKERFFFRLYGFFNRTNATIAMQIMIAMKSPTIAGMKYWSAMDGTWVGMGVGVAVGGSTVNAETARDP